MVELHTHLSVPCVLMFDYNNMIFDVSVFVVLASVNVQLLFTMMKRYCFLNVIFVFVESS